MVRLTFFLSKRSLEFFFVKIKDNYKLLLIVSQRASNKTLNISKKKSWIKKLT